MNMIETMEYLHSLCIESEGLIFSSSGGNVNVYGIFAHDETQTFCWWERDEIILVIKVVLFLVLGGQRLHFHVLTYLSGRLVIQNIPPFSLHDAQGDVLRVSAMQPGAVFLPLQLDLELGGAAVGAVAEAVVQFGHVRAAPVLLVLFAELDADFGGARRVALSGLVLTAAAVSTPT